MYLSKKILKQIIDRAKDANKLICTKICLEECTADELQEIIYMMCLAWGKISNNTRHTFINKYNGVARRILVDYNPETKMFLPYFNLLCIPNKQGFVKFSVVRLLQVFTMIFWNLLKTTTPPKIKIDILETNKNFETAIRNFFNAKLCEKIEFLSETEKYILNKAVENRHLVSLHKEIRKVNMMSLER